MQAPSDLPSGTVTFLFTDIEGSTGLWDQHREQMRQALSRHDELLRGAIDRHGGHVFATGGDGFAAAFGRAADAVAAAVEAQRALGAERWPDPIDLRVRMGVHTGEAHEREGDYLGPPVNRAARLMSSAHGGQLLLSALTAELLEPNEELELIDLGPVHLAGIVEPVQVFGVATPGLEWLDLPLAPQAPTKGNLPRPRNEFVGDLADLRQRASRLSQARLVTLTGSGGVGKTRAAIEVGGLVADEFVDGVWFVDLAPVADPNAAVAAIASTLLVQPQPGTTLTAAILDWCIGRRVLLIIDNCEHVLDPVAELVAAVTASSQTATVLATSREPLGIEGERVIRIPSLSLADGIQLFHDRALAATDDFTPRQDDLDAISAICVRLDGIPLALELAAARTRSLTPAEILARLDDRFRLLRGSGRGGLERHQTLRAAVAWSYQLLSDDEKAMFDRLSVFAGTFDLEGAEAVAAGGNIDELDVVDLLGELVDKSIVIAERDDHGYRYRLLESLRQYAEERLADRGEVEALRDRHLDYYAALAARTHDQWFSPDQLQADAAFTSEWDNLRAAFGWAVAQRELEVVDGLLLAVGWHSVLEVRYEHRDWALEGLSLREDAGAASAGPFAIAAVWAFFAADVAGALELSRRGIRECPDDELVGGCWAWLLYALVGSGQIEEAKEILPRVREHRDRKPPFDASFMLHQVLADTPPLDDQSSDDLRRFTELCNRVGNPAGLTRRLLAEANRMAGTTPPDLPGALDRFAEVLDLGAEASPSEVAWASSGLVMCQLLEHHPGALESLRFSLVHCYDLRLWFAVDLVLGHCVTYLLETGATEPAAIVLGSIAQRAPSGMANITELRAEALATVNAADGGREAMAIGAAMDRHEIVALATEHLAANGASAGTGDAPQLR